MLLKVNTAALIGRQRADVLSGRRNGAPERRASFSGTCAWRIRPPSSSKMRDALAGAASAFWWRSRPIPRPSIRTTFRPGPRTRPGDRIRSPLRQAERRGVRTVDLRPVLKALRAKGRKPICSTMRTGPRGARSPGSMRSSRQTGARAASRSSDCDGAARGAKRGRRGADPGVQDEVRETTENLACLPENFGPVGGQEYLSARRMHHRSCRSTPGGRGQRSW